MTLHSRSRIAVASIAVLFAAGATANEVSVAVASGPYAGTYGSKTDVECFHSKSQEIFAATFKDWHAQSARSFRTSGIRVYKPDAPGSKSGELSVTFGGAQATAQYLVTKIPLTVTPNGKGADIMGEGNTKDGIKVRVTAKCAEILQL
ncbi:MAG TPA: hypothetical protein VGH20_06225 [Myxococcales bacterium]|jgi:hypothetical protein